MSATFLTRPARNLGTIQTLWRAFQRWPAAMGAWWGTAGMSSRVSWWGLDGMAKSLTGVPLPDRNGEWAYAEARSSPPWRHRADHRVPLFTFLYSDLHAHILVMMLALFIIAWGLSFVVAMRTIGTQVIPISRLLSHILPPIFLGALVAWRDRIPPLPGDAYTSIRWPRWQWVTRCSTCFRHCEERSSPLVRRRLFPEVAMTAIEGECGTERIRFTFCLRHSSAR